MMYLGYPVHSIDLLAKLYSKQLTEVKVAGTLSEWFGVKKGSPTRLCPFSVLVQYPSAYGDEVNPRWISRLTTNWRANNHGPSLR